MGRRPTRYALTGIVLAATVVAGGILVAQQNQPAPYPSAEVVADRGFAVWPEDTVGEAQNACETRATDEPWRLTPEGVVSEFARRSMNIPDPEIDQQLSDISAEDAEIWLNVPNELATIFTLFKAGECWHIGFIDHREGASFPFSYTFDGEALTAHLVDSRFLQLGFGTEDREKPDGEGRAIRWRFEEEITEPGHFMVIGFNRRGIGDIVGADALPPPPEPRAGETIFPPSDEPLWPARNEDSFRCSQQVDAGRHPEGVVNHLLQWDFNRAMPDGPYPDVLHRGEDGPIGRRVERYRESNRRWRLVVDDVTYEVRLTRVTDRCWAIQRLEAVGRRGVLKTIWLNGDTSTVEVRPRWHKAGVAIHYGTSGDFMSVRPELGVSVSDPDAGAREDAFFPREPQLSGLVSAFVVQKGRYVNAEIRRLPPLD